MDWRKKSQDLLNNISKDYRAFNKLINLKNAPRKRKLSYSLICEKNIVNMIMEILEGKEYHYNMDIPLNASIDNSLSKGLINQHKWYPDLLIQDKNNNIIAIIEIKYQIGYWKYEKDIDKINNYKYKNKTIIVNLLESNHSKKIKNAIERFDEAGIKFYTLYNSNVKYNKINKDKYENIFIDEQHGFEAFIEKINSL